MESIVWRQRALQFSQKMLQCSSWMCSVVSIAPCPKGDGDSECDCVLTSQKSILCSLLLEADATWLSTWRARSHRTCHGDAAALLSVVRCTSRHIE